MYKKIKNTVFDIETYTGGVFPTNGLPRHLGLWYIAAPYDSREEIVKGVLWNLKQLEEPEIQEWYGVKNGADLQNLRIYFIRDLAPFPFTEPQYKVPW